MSILNFIRLTHNEDYGIEFGRFIKLKSTNPPVKTCTAKASKIIEVLMMDHIPEYRRKQFRTIYESLYENLKIAKKSIAENLDVCKKTAYTRFEEAMQHRIIVGPEIRKRSYTNLSEYMCFAKCEDPESAYLTCCRNPIVFYNALASGFCNLWVIAKDTIDIDGDIIIEGYRSDYHVSYAPDHSWEKALNILKKRVENFNFDDYTPKEIIKTHLDNRIPWDDKDELLYQGLKYFLRNRTHSIMEEHTIPLSKVNRFMEDLPQYCTIATQYFPDGRSHYDPYLYMVRTNYEDYIIELFSQLPTSSTFFNLSGMLFFHIYIARGYPEISPHPFYEKRCISRLIKDLVKKGVIKDVNRIHDEETHEKAL
jgi:hypothetical protein